MLDIFLNSSQQKQKTYRTEKFNIQMVPHILYHI